MAVTKRTRFEVLRRDAHTCRYCRSTTNELTVDHVVPVALGGSDAPENLVAACRDCNAGKSSSSPDASLVANVSDDAVRWAAARKAAMGDVERKIAADKKRQAEIDDAIFTAWKIDEKYLPDDWRQSVNSWLRMGLSLDVIVDSIEVAYTAYWVSQRDMFRYAAGVVRNRIAALDEATRERLAEDERGLDEIDPVSISQIVEHLDLVTTRRLLFNVDARANLSAVA